MSRWRKFGRVWKCSKAKSRMFCAGEGRISPIEKPAAAAASRRSYGYCNRPATCSTSPGEVHRGTMIEDWWHLGRLAIAVILAGYLGISGLKKKSLDKSGAIAGFAVGLASIGLSLRLGLTLILFYKSSSVLTKVGFDKKVKLTADYKEGGQRDAVQVLSCSAFATIVAVVHFFHVGVGDSLVDFGVQPWGAALLCAYLGFYACCAGDTWSSELGVLSTRPPRLITSPWRVVPRGTNGGVSLEGTVASAVAGGVIGAGFVLFGWLFRLSTPPPETSISSVSQLPLIVLGTASGLVGSILDSWMGAVFQASYFDRNRKVIVEKPSPSELSGGDLELLCGRDILSNEQINALSNMLPQSNRIKGRKIALAVFTSVLAGVLGRFLL